MNFVLSFLLMLTVIQLSPVAMADETSDLRAKVKALELKVAALQDQITAQPVTMNNTSLNTSPSAGYIPSQPTTAVYEPSPLSHKRLMEQHMNQINQMNQMMQANAFSPMVFNTQEDIQQTPDAYIISMTIPNMQKDNINIEVKKGVLIVSGESKTEINEEKPNAFTRHEQSFGNFYRTIVLSQDAKSDAIDAKYDNGVLTVKIPKVKPVGSANAGQKIKIK